MDADRFVPVPAFFSDVSKTLVIYLFAARQGIGDVELRPHVIELTQDTPLRLEEGLHLPGGKDHFLHSVTVDVPALEGAALTIASVSSMLEYRASQMGQIEAAEEAVPVGAVALGLVEVALRPGIIPA